MRPARAHRYAGVAMIAAVLMAACGGGGERQQRGNGDGVSRLVGTVRPCVPPPSLGTAPEAVAALLPAGLSLPDDAEVTAVSDAEGMKTVVARTRLQPSALHARYTAQAEAAGYPVLKTDDEIIEAELYFSLPDGGLGLAQQVRARCPEGATQTIISTVAAEAGPVTTVPRPLP